MFLTFFKTFFVKKINSKVDIVYRVSKNNETGIVFNDVLIKPGKQAHKKVEIIPEVTPNFFLLYFIIDNDKIPLMFYFSCLKWINNFFNEIIEK